MSGAVEVIGDQQSQDSWIYLNNTAIVSFSAKQSGDVLVISQLRVVENSEFSQPDNLVIEFERMRNLLGYKKILYADENFKNSQLLERAGDAYQLVVPEDSDPFAECSEG